jgi:hypothetical protein
MYSHPISPDLHPSFIWSSALPIHTSIHHYINIKPVSDIRYESNSNFMCCWTCILIIFFKETNLMHYLSLIYFITQLLHVSGIYCPSSGGIHCICTAVGTCYTFTMTGSCQWKPPDDRQCMLKTCRGWVTK